MINQILYDLFSAITKYIILGYVLYFLISGIIMYYNGSVIWNILTEIFDKDSILNNKWKLVPFAASVVYQFFIFIQSFYNKN